MTMKLFIICVSLTTLTGLLFAQNSLQDSLLKEEMKKLDLAHARAIFQRDAKALDSLMDDDVTVNHPTNRIVKEKKELLDLIKQGVIRYTAFERFPETFLFFNDLVVVMGSEIVIPARVLQTLGKQFSVDTQTFG